MARKCVRFRNTDSGRRCAEFEDDEESGSDGSSRRELTHRMRGMVTIPGLQGYGVFDKSVNSTDVVIGALAGMAGSAAFKLFTGNYLKDKLPVFLQNAMPLIGSVVTGTALFMVERSKSRQRAQGHLVGAVAAGAAVQAWGYLKGMTKSDGTPMFPGLADVVSLNLGRYGGRYGLLVDERTPRIGPGAMGGLIVNDPVRAQLQGYADNPNLASLAAASMGDDASGMEELMGLDE